MSNRLLLFLQLNAETKSQVRITSPPSRHHAITSLMPPECGSMPADRVFHRWRRWSVEAATVGGLRRRCESDLKQETVTVSNLMARREENGERRRDGGRKVGGVRPNFLWQSACSC